MSNLVEGGGFEPPQPFQAADLQSAPINRSGTPPDNTLEPERGVEPLTYRLQIGCAAIAPLGLPFSCDKHYRETSSMNKSPAADVSCHVKIAVQKGG